MKTLTLFLCLFLINFTYASQPILRCGDFYGEIKNPCGFSKELGFCVSSIFLSSKGASVSFKQDPTDPFELLKVFSPLDMDVFMSEGNEIYASEELVLDRDGKKL